MARGFRVDVANGTLEFVNGNRVVQTTAGRLVTLLPGVVNVAGQAATFPDVSKDELYIWTGSTRSDFNSKNHFAESCTAIITALPQEFSAKLPLVAAPAGADVFVGHLRLTRITAPQNTWQQRRIGVLPVEGRWMPITGALSVLCEAEIALARALHVYLDAVTGALVLEVEQSVGAAIGGYTGASGTSGGFVFTDRLSYHDEGNCLYRSTAGMPIHVRERKSYGYTNPGVAGDIVFASNQRRTFMREGTNPCARGDTTNYTSVYSVDITGRFGRRS